MGFSHERGTPVTPNPLPLTHQATIEQFGEEGRGLAGVPGPPLSKRRLSEEESEDVMASLDEELIRTISSGSDAPQDDLVGGDNLSLTPYTPVLQSADPRILPRA